jgi:hypothetical protein
VPPALTWPAIGPIIEKVPAESQRPLRRGDIVEVRPPAEILATLGQDGALGGVPFMPEMLKYAGRRFRVSTRVEKFCDTIHGSRSRRIRDTVYLDDLRCDGSGHGGCQAACRLYWKEDWLVRAGENGESSPAPDDEAALAELERVTGASSRRREQSEKGAVELFRCQATDALAASEPLREFDLRQYIRELRSGNVGVRRLFRVALRAVEFMVGRRLRLIGPISIKARFLVKVRPGAEASEPLGLAVGDWVRVKSEEEIRRTLDERGKNRGLWFDREMRSYCGGIYRVKARIDRIIDERTGRMIEIKSDCFVLDGVVCTSNYSRSRWLCPREIPHYWREAWLRRVDPPPWATVKPIIQADAGTRHPRRRPRGAA